MTFDTGAAEKLAEGARILGIPAGPAEIDLFSRYGDLLQLWGKKMNLTSRLKGREIAVYHFLDSLSAFRTIAGRGGGNLVDIGAGAGFPALPLKICIPGLRAVLVESSRKKVSFCREVVRRLELPDVEVLHERGELLSAQEGYGEIFDWAVTRAVGASADMAKICLPFLRPGGTAILYKATLEGEELEALEEETSRAGASLSLLPVTVPFLDAPRTLALVTKRST